MRIEIITRLDALEQMVEEWWALFLAARSPSPFQSPAWLLAWYRNLGRGELRVLAVRDGTILTGLAPFTMRSEQGKRVLRPLGAGVTDICDVLIARREKREPHKPSFAGFCTNWSSISAIGPGCRRNRPLSELLNCRPFLRRRGGCASLAAACGRNAARRGGAVGHRGQYIGRMRASGKTGRAFVRDPRAGAV
jgi:hypothetical protein